MAQRNELIAGGMAAELSRLIGFDVAATGLVATGSTLAGALALTSNFSLITTSSASTGVQLPPATGNGPVAILNGSGQTIYVYPQVGDYINAKAVAAANSTNSVAVSMTDGQVMIAFPSGNRWLSVQS